MDQASTLTLLDAEGTTVEPAWDAVTERFEAGTTLWLDMDAPTDDDIDRMADLFGFHRLAVEDTHDFSQRAKLVVYDDHAFVVAFAASPDDRIEVHCYYRPGVVVTVHREACPPVSHWLDQGFDHEFDAPGLFLLYRLLDSLASSFPPILDEIDEHLIQLEDAILDNPDPVHMSDLSTLKRQLSRLRRAVIPGRDTLGGGTSLAIEELPGMSDEARRYFRDLYDHLVHVAEQVDSEREHAASVMDVYLSTVSNKQNDVMKQLTALSTFFLPLMFVTGFFGMNFPWMVRHIEGWGWFLLLGVGLQVLSVAVVLVLLRRRRWY